MDDKDDLDEDNDLDKDEDNKNKAHLRKHVEEGGGEEDAGSKAEQAGCGDFLKR